jgi:succinate-semialdehyde dehydrogenase / glutarate-semialdehyde dehydrogenase
VSVQTRSIRVVNPATEEEVAEYDEHTLAQIEQAIADAHDAQRRWRDVGFDERDRIVRAAAAVLRRRRDEFARLITIEMGKPLAEAAAEVEKCAWTCDFFADQGPAFLADRPVETTAESSYVRA